MRSFFTLLIAIGALWAIDVIALDSRYSEPLWRDVKHQAQNFNNEISRWLNKLGL
jgi:hypothetical protein